MSSSYAGDSAPTNRSGTAGYGTYPYYAVSTSGPNMAALVTDPNSARRLAGMGFGSTVPLASPVGTAAGLSDDLQAKIRQDKRVTSSVAAWKGASGGGDTTTPKPLPPSNPNEYKWNLPPHAWSLPVTPSTDPNFMPEGYSRPTVDDRYRRGRIWWKYNESNLIVQDSSGGTSYLDNGDGRKYGFQFLWNPEAFSTSVAVQMDATPNVNDRFMGAVGMFPATQNISFNIRLDRTNDFACFIGNEPRPTELTKASRYVSLTKAVAASKHYSGRGFQSGAGEIQDKVFDLLQRGTLADLDFLYKAINGTGPGGDSTNGSGSAWVNGRGIKTSDIGFLMPTLLNIDIGPLSYQGFVTNLTVNHVGFTQEMIPIRTDIGIALNVLATAGLSSEYAQSQAQ